MRSITLPKGIPYLGNQVFNPNVGLGYVPYKALPIEETLFKSNKVLEKYGYEPISRLDLETDQEEISAEVGDDDLTLSNSKAYVSFLCVCYTEMGMCISQQDTSINPRYGNFAEDLICLPDGYGQTYLNARKTGGFKDMSFIDIPKLRLAIDIRPMRMDHSGTNDGKASMVGARQRWIPQGSNWRGIYELFSLFQDVNLGLHRDKKFPYFPSSLGGYGKLVPFQNYMNLEKFMKAFKQGQHSELIREVVWRTNNFFHEVIRDRRPKVDALLSHITRYQSSFHDWVKGRSIYAPVTWIDVPPEVAKWSVGKTGRSPHEDEAIARLLAERKILSEQSLEIAVEHNALCNALLKAENINTFKRVRDEAKRKWSQLSTFSMESYGLIVELGLEFDERQKPLTVDEIRQFYTFVIDKRYNLKHILRSEFVYDVKAMDEIYKVGPMKVNFDFMPRVGMHARGFAANSRSYRTDVEDTEEIGALDELLAWLKVNALTGKTLTKMPTIIVNDDEPIIRECSYYTYNIIVTDDKKLCRNANYRTKHVVFRVPTLWYYKSVYFGLSDWTEYLDKAYPGLEWHYHEDSGSIKAFEESHFRDGVMLSEAAYQKFNFFKKLPQRDVVVMKEFEEFEDGPPRDVLSLFYDRDNILRLRRNTPKRFGKDRRLTSYY